MNTAKRILLATCFVFAFVFAFMFAFADNTAYAADNEYAA